MRGLGGGDLSRVFEVTLADGRAAIAKETPGAGVEAAMLRAIRRTGCPAPEVLFAADDLLVMERLEAGGVPDDAAWRAAGIGVALLHAASGPGYGWPDDHAFGPVPIPNGAAGDWPAFWGERRLLAWPGTLPRDLARCLEALARRLPELLPARPRPALLHGDLWSGNLVFGPGGFSGLIDPAAGHGDPEVDLAMLTLFGRPPPAFLGGYGPLASGWQARRPVYQLWPALVHLRLFGEGYRPMVARLLAASGA